MEFFEKNKYTKSLRDLIVFSALTHIFLLIIYTIIKKDIAYLNYLSIIDLDVILPSMAHNSLGHIASFFILVAVYLIFLYLASQKEKKS